MALPGSAALAGCWGLRRGRGAARRAGARPPPPSCWPRAPRLGARGPSGSPQVSERPLLPAGWAPGVSCGLRGRSNRRVGLRHPGSRGLGVPRARPFPGSWGQSRGPLGRACMIFHRGCLRFKSVDLGANLAGPWVPAAAAARSSVFKASASSCHVTEGPTPRASLYSVRDVSFVR